MNQFVVHRGKNFTKKEVLFAVSKKSKADEENSHLSEEEQKAIKHWKKKDQVEWDVIGRWSDEEGALKESRAYEDLPPQEGWKVITASPF
jgi:hypothetical protein